MWDTNYCLLSSKLLKASVLIKLLYTDNVEIANLAKDMAEVPFMRSKKLSDDYTGTVPVISHAVKWQTKNFQNHFLSAVFMQLHLLLNQHLKYGLKILKKFKPEYTFSATNYTYPIQRSFRIKKYRKIEMFYPKHYNSRSQDLRSFS